jgi:DNA-binding response OmpR family regulator
MCFQKGLCLIKILVVDDDASVAGFVGSFIEKLGHYVEKASSGQEALTRFKENTFDLVLLECK